MVVRDTVEDLTRTRERDGTGSRVSGLPLSVTGTMTFMIEANPSPTLSGPTRTHLGRLTVWSWVDTGPGFRDWGGRSDEGAESLTV